MCTWCVFAYFFTVIFRCRPIGIAAYRQLDSCRGDDGGSECLAGLRQSIYPSKCFCSVADLSRNGCSRAGVAAFRDTCLGNIRPCVANA